MPVPSERLEQLVAALLTDGHLPEADLKELESILAEDEEAREYYVLSQELHTMLDTDKSIRLQLAADLLPENLIAMPGVDVSKVAEVEKPVTKPKAKPVVSKSALRLATSVATLSLGLLVLIWMSTRVGDFTKLISSSGDSNKFASDKVSFHKEVFPVLKTHCFECHGENEENRKADLRLDVGKSAFQGDEPAIVCGEPESSQLIARISSSDPDFQMPPPDFEKPLSTLKVQLIRKWIEQGAEYDSEWSAAEKMVFEMLIAGF